MSRLADLVRGGTPGPTQEGEGRTVARVARVASAPCPKTQETGRTVARVARVASPSLPITPDSAPTPPNNNNNNVNSLYIYRGLASLATATLATPATQEGETGQAWPHPEPATIPPPLSAPTCESWEERAAILEFDAGLTRTEAEEQATCRRWLIRFPDGWRDTTHTPPASLAELRAWYPSALAILPADDDAEPWDPERGEPGQWGEDDPGAAFYAALFAGMTGPRCLVTLNPEDTHRAVVAGLVRPEEARGAVLLAIRDPQGHCALLTIPKEQWDPFTALALLTTEPGTLH